MADSYWNAQHAFTQSLDGGLRDTKDILEQGFPMWRRYLTPNGSLSRAEIHERRGYI